MNTPDRVTKQMEGLTEDQVDLIYCIQYSYSMEIGRIKLGERGTPTLEIYQNTTSLYNGIIGDIFEGHIN